MLIRTSRPLACHPAGARQLEGRFTIDGRVVHLQMTRWDEPARSDRVPAQWRELADGSRFFHLQQVGLRPTFLAVASADDCLGRAFLCELLGGGWLWSVLRRNHLLFLVSESEVAVCPAPGRKARPSWSELATHRILPRVREAVAATTAARIRREKARRCLQEGVWPAQLGTPWVSSSGALSTGLRGDCRVVVAGAIGQDEAEALVQELAGIALWQPERHGHLLVRIKGPRGEVSVRFERTNPVDEASLERWVAGFLRQVILSDLHLGLRHRDTFGPQKIPLLRELLLRTIADRSTLLLNGDFLELLHERYGAIKRSYCEVFELLPRVRRIVYLAGNHDEDVLAEVVKQARRSVRRVAAQQAYAEVVLTPNGSLTIHPLRPGHRGLLRRWQRCLEDPRLRRTLSEILDRRHGNLRLSRGFPGEEVAFKRQGRRDTPDERPQWFLDERVLSHPDPAAHILKLVADRRQRLDRVIAEDWNHNVRFDRYHCDPQRGLYFEHGHFAVPSCSDSPVGRLVSTLAGWLKRAGMTGIEHLFEEQIGGWLRAIRPFTTRRLIQQYAEREIAVATALARSHPEAPGFTLVCGHTHEQACLNEGPVHSLVHQASGASYANTGAWSSRLRLRREGLHSVEWMEADAGGGLTIRTARTSERPVVSPSIWTAMSPSSAPIRQPA